VRQLTSFVGCDAPESNNLSGKTSCAVGAPPSMKIAWRGAKYFIFNMHSGSFHSSAFTRWEKDCGHYEWPTTPAGISMLARSGRTGL
jgi:hypothetical protein